MESKRGKFTYGKISGGAKNDGDHDGPIHNQAEHIEWVVNKKEAYFGA
jgi:hypothetical protein